MRTLPVSLAFSHIMSSTLNNLRHAFHSHWPWVAVWSVLLAGLMAIMSMGLGGAEGLDDPAVRESLRERPALAFLIVLWVVALLVVGLIAISSVAVNWHRYVLKDELPTGVSRLRVDRLVWRYLGNAVLITLIAGLVGIPVATIASLVLSFLGPFGLPFILAAVVLVVMPVFYRLSVKLPAIALGREDFTLTDAWKATEGNWWQIAGLAVFITLLSFAASLVLLLAAQVLQLILPDQLANFVDVLLQIAINWVLMIISITTLTSLYGYFVEGRDF